MASDVITAIVIDDEENACYLITHLLQSFKLGIKVIGEAHDGKDGLEQFFQKTPDIVLTDIDMPMMSGLECLRQMKAYNPDTEILMISAYNDFDYVKLALIGKAFSYILKPIDDEELYNTIKQIRELILKRKKCESKRRQMNHELEKLKRVYVAGERVGTGLNVDGSQGCCTIINKVINYVRSSYYKDISLQSLADKVFLNPTYLSELFKRETGYNFITYLNKLRISKAKELLSLPEFKITEIADMVGYNDSSYFIRVFKKTVGISPSKFRDKRLRKSETNQRKFTELLN